MEGRAPPPEDARVLPEPTDFCRLWLFRHPELDPAHAQCAVGDGPADLTRRGRAQVLRCAELTMKKRGGAPVRSQIGRFTSVRDQARPLGEVAIRSDGLFVLSGGQYFRDVLDEVAGVSRPDDKARQREQLHAGVRRRLGPNQVSMSTVTLEPRPDPPGVRSIGIAIDVRKRTRLRGYAGCDTPKDCENAASMADSLRQALAKEPLFAPLASVRVALDGSELLAEGEMANEQLGPMLAKLLAQ